MKILFVLPTIFFFTSPAYARKSDPLAPTFSKEVVRIFQHDCQTCHRPGGLAPFSLLDYKDALAHAKSIDEEVRNRTMPPWKPVAGCGDFVGDKSLSQADIDAIHAWVAAGAPEGNPSDLPPRKDFPTDWKLGPPDVTLASTAPYPMGAEDEDEYRCFVLPYVAQKDDYLVGLSLIHI